MRCLSRLPKILTAAALAAGLVSAYSVASPRSSAATAAGRGRARSQAVTGGSSAYDWPTFHRGPQRWGLAANSTLSTSNAASLGVTWATGLYGAALDSPVVAWDGKLSKTIAYIGTEQGNLFAVDVATGKIIWSAWLGGPIRSTPVVASGFVWAATWNSPRIYKLDASTGAVQCSASLPQEIEGSPLVVTPPGGVQTLYIGTNDTSSASGPVVAINTSDCLREWTWQKYNVQSGTWDPIGYAVDANGRPLVLLGSANPDSSVYAINALTGVTVWRFAATNPPGDYDIGAGITVSLPGINGFAGGVAYTVSKYGVIYAIELTTGAQIWSYQALGVLTGDISTPALDGTNLVVGYNKGILDVNAVTGALIWTSSDPAGLKAISSPALA
jgi:eukaryotic-like serine/threonine-protein kinase